MLSRLSRRRDWLNVLLDRVNCLIIFSLHPRPRRHRRWGTVSLLVQWVWERRRPCHLVSNRSSNNNSNNSLALVLVLVSLVSRSLDSNHNTNHLFLNLLFDGTIVSVYIRV